MKRSLAILAMLTSIMLVISTVSVIQAFAAESAEITLKAEIIPAVSFTVDTTLLDFGKLAAGDRSKDEKVRITNDGAKDIKIDAEVTGDLFVEGIEIGKEQGEYFPWDTWSIEVDSGKSDNIKVALDVPDDFAGSGAYEGSMTLWAEIA